MSELTRLSDTLSDQEWLAGISEIGDELGYFEQVGADHSALFIDESLEVLLVSFDTIASARTGSQEGLPHALTVAQAHGWSHLSLLANRASWFRDPAVYSYFDRLVDDAFFEDFDRIIFFGAGACGYAAAAYSVAAPGATVIAIAPQATLDPQVAIWDDRFVGLRRTDFSSRYGYAPEMVDACEAAYIIYDPTVELDAMHAALFRGPQVRHIPFRHGGPQLGGELQAMDVLGGLFAEAAAGTLTKADFFAAFRARRTHLPYLRNLLNRTHIEDRDFLVALLCRAVLRTTPAPRFKHHLELARQRLATEGRALPAEERKSRAAERLPELR
ncbi:MAG: phosphoadenosine phosphosulfate reductase [Pseudomonadota bacterium]